VLRYVLFLSITQQCISKEQHEKHLCNLSSQCGSMKNSLEKRAPHISIWESHNASISAMTNSFHNIVNKEWCEKCHCDLYVLHWSYYTSTTNCHRILVGISNNNYLIINSYISAINGCRSHEGQFTEGTVVTFHLNYTHSLQIAITSLVFNYDAGCSN